MKPLTHDCCSYNANTKKYVMWTNLVPDGNFQLSAYVVAVSDTPQGPFTVVTTNVTTRYPVSGADVRNDLIGNTRF